MSSIYKELYGEVETPLFFVEKMFEMIPKYIFKNKDLKWLDVGLSLIHISEPTRPY